MEVHDDLHLKAAVNTLRQLGLDDAADWMDAAIRKQAAERNMGSIATRPARSVNLVPIKPDGDPSADVPDPDGPFMAIVEWPDGHRMCGLLISALYGKRRDLYLIEVGDVRLTVPLQYGFDPL
jgi:hypothetical protein